MENIIKDKKFDKAKVGNIVKLYHKVNTGYGSSYESFRTARIVYKNSDYLCVKYIPEDIVGRYGEYRECFLRFDFNKSKIEFIK